MIPLFLPRICLSTAAHFMVVDALKHVAALKAEFERRDLWTKCLETEFLRYL